MKETSRKRLVAQVATMAALIGIIGTVIGYLEQRSAREVDVGIRVSDSSGARPISGAEVFFMLGDVQYAAVTDTKGQATLRMPSNARSKTVQVSVLKDGYETNTRYVSIPSPSDVMAFVLHQTEPPKLTHDRLVKTFSSPAVPSGIGANFSGWYEVSAEPPPNGYIIDVARSYFFMRGDRECNAWSECVWVDNTDQKLSFRFRLQGHSERPYSGQALSQGFLHVEYIPVPITTKYVTYAVSGTFQRGFKLSDSSKVIVEANSGLEVSANLTVEGPDGSREQFVGRPVYNIDRMWQWQNQGSLGGSLDFQDQERTFVRYAGRYVLTNSAYWTPALGINITSSDTVFTPIASSETYP
jgi:hypothetical protein